MQRTLSQVASKQTLESSLKHTRSSYMVSSMMLVRYSLLGHQTPTCMHIVPWPSR